MRSLQRAALAAGLGIAAGLTGCGAGTPNCSGDTLVLQVSPAAATVDRLAASPANQVHFQGVAHYSGSPGCAVPAIAFSERATWTNPDPVNIEISSANDATNGTALCKGPTNGAVTLTGEFAPITIPPATQTTTKTVQLTCR